MKDSIFHKPVMVDEIIESLELKSAHKILDATVGCGGHARYILKKTEKENTFLIGIDRDETSLKVAKKNLNGFNERYKLIHANFTDVAEVLSGLGFKKIDRALFDLGLSSYQLEDENRGFSFMREGPLDMRMDQSRGMRASDIINKYGKRELESIIRDFGEERYFRRITGFILEERKKSPITTTGALSSLIKKAVGPMYRSQKIHPATRTFQALRIAVNRELDSLEKGLTTVLDFLNPKGRICVISFHSLEDRIVKLKFREFEKQALGRIITKKPIIPTVDEIKGNPRARSAKLRVFERIG